MILSFISKFISFNFTNSCQTLI